MSAAWECPSCGQILPEDQPSCRICHVTRDNRHVTGRIPVQTRTPKPPPEFVEVPFPFVLKQARFLLPLAGGAIWSSGWIVAVEEGLYLVSERDGLSLAVSGAAPPAEAGPVGPLSIFAPKGAVTRVVHEKLIGQFAELNGRQRIPLRLEPSGWQDLDVLCDRLGIPHS